MFKSSTLPILLGATALLCDVLFGGISLDKQNEVKGVKVSKSFLKGGILVPVAVNDAVYFNNTVRVTLTNKNNTVQKYLPIFKGAYTDCVKKTVDYCVQFLKKNPHMICTPSCVDGNLGVEKVKGTLVSVPAHSSKEVRIYNIPTHNYQGADVVVGKVKAKCKIDNMKQVN
ncbi:MAG TPA: hypothetical protein ENK74_00960 [Nitratifractor sp.]|nr:hypothetical protein [Nitratifractor sp.]